MIKKCVIKAVMVIIKIICIFSSGNHLEWMPLISYPNLKILFNLDQLFQRGFKCDRFVMYYGRMSGNNRCSHDLLGKVS